MEEFDLRGFYEELGEKYPEEEITYRTLRGILRKRFVLKQLENFQGSLLDIGCNKGIYLREYKKGIGVGVDISLNVLKKARKELVNGRLVLGDAEDLGFRNESFHNVLCSEVLEHVLHPDRVMREISRVLKPGGKALITTPNYKGRKPGWVDIGILREYGVRKQDYFHTAFTPEELEKLAEGSNLRVIERGTLEKEVKYAAKIPALIFIITREINRRLFRSGRLDYLNQGVFESLTLLIYRMCRLTGLNWLLLKFIPRGVRSFVLVEKGGKSNVE